MSSGYLFLVALEVMCQRSRVLVRILTLASYSCFLAYVVEHKLVSILGSCTLLVAKVLCGTHTGLKDSESPLPQLTACWMAGVCHGAVIASVVQEHCCTMGLHLIALTLLPPKGPTSQY